MQVFVTRALPGGALDTLRALPDVACDVWPDDEPPPYETIRDRVPALDGLLCLLTDRIDAPLLEAAPQLRVVSQMAVGVDNIDLAAATRLGIPVGHTPGVLTETTADLAWALILATARRLPEAERFLRAGSWRHWSPGLLLGRDVHGATLGIVGMGAIGAAVARRARGFDMRVLYSSRSPKEVPDARPVPLDELLRDSDIVSIHCALTPETRGLIGRRELELTKPSACLINTARGEIVDEGALFEALSAGRIAAAGLDVYEKEPLPADSPLLVLPNVVLLPHVGSATLETRGLMAARAVDNLIAGLRGERLPFCANPDVSPRG